MYELVTRRLIHSACIFALNDFVLLLCKRSAKKRREKPGIRLSRYFEIRNVHRMITFGIAITFFQKYIRVKARGKPTSGK